MKSIKEKQMLVKWAKALNEEIDSTILREVEEYDRIQEELKQSLKQNPFIETELSKEPLPILKEEKLQEIKQSVISKTDLISRSVEQISKDALREESFQQPDPSLVGPDINEIRKKIKFLEQWISKVSMAGPGGGEVRLKFLDDVDRATIAENRHLAYNATTDTFFFEDVISTGELFDDNYTTNISVGNVISVINLPNNDIGPIRSLKVDELGYGSNANVAAGLISWNNTEDCLNITHADSSTLQVGLENYIRVYNNTANTFSNGTFVEFTGVDVDGKSPTFRAFENNANARPLYSIGVLTTDIQSNTHGRATCLGLVRDLDTTGNAVGESWSIGDILWANPSYPGKFTKVKPTSPNVAISVAAVTTVDETDGMILVRPAIWPRLRYGDFFSTTTQTAPTSNTDVQLSISNTLISSGFTLTGNTMVALDSGLYKFQSRVQIVSSSSSTKSIVLWYKKNAVNVERSAVRQSVSENGGFRTITNTQIISLDAGDNVSVHFAVTDTSLSVAAPATLDGAPQIPSIQIAISEIAL